MHAARFPLHRDLMGFEFEQSKVDQRQIEAFADVPPLSVAGPFRVRG